MPYNSLIHKRTGMKIPLKAITVVYTRTRTFTPTTEMFQDWDVEPTQEEFERVMRDEFYDMIYEEMSGKGNPRDYTHVEQLATVEIEYEPFEIVEFDSSIFDEDT